MRFFVIITLAMLYATLLEAGFLETIPNKSGRSSVGSTVNTIRKCCSSGQKKPQNQYLEAKTMTVKGSKGKDFQLKYYVYKPEGMSSGTRVQIYSGPICSNVNDKAFQYVFNLIKHVKETRTYDLDKEKKEDTEEPGAYEEEDESDDPEQAQRDNFGFTEEHKIIYMWDYPETLFGLDPVRVVDGLRALTQEAMKLRSEFEYSTID
jgi:hypothetical protein